MSSLHTLSQIFLTPFHFSQQPVRFTQKSIKDAHTFRFVKHDPVKMLENLLLGFASPNIKHNNQNSPPPNRVSPFSPTVYTNRHDAETIAEEMFQYTFQHEPDLKALLDLIEDTIDLGSRPDLNPLFQCKAIEEILDNKADYENLQDLLDAVALRQTELLAQLTFSQKLRYALRIKTMFDGFTARMALQDELGAIYGKMRGVSVGVGVTDIVTYSFRRDKLDNESVKIIGLFIEKLKTATNQKNNRWWWLG